MSLRLIQTSLIGTAMLLSSVFPGQALSDVPRLFDAATAANRRSGTTVRIDLIGDSTQAERTGYGLGFCANLTTEVDCLNMARGGTSTRSYRELGLWDQALKTKPDFMLIQFGHNDLVTPDHLAAQVPLEEYRANLTRFVKEARAVNIHPILVTPITRLNFGPDGKVHTDLEAYSNAMRQVAIEARVPLIDLEHDSQTYLNELGIRKGMAFALTKKDKFGNTTWDHTHLNYAGSYTFGRIVALDLGKTIPDLTKYIRPTAAELPAEGVKAMQVLRQGPVRIVLVGDSTVNAQGGWGKTFCDLVTHNVTCINDAINGRSSKSFIAEDYWRKALADRGDYYLIQFGHNDQPGKGPERETDPDTTYSDNLRRYISDVRSIGAVPIIVTSLSRRNYKNGALVLDLAPYANAAKHIAAEQRVTLVDLNALSIKLLQTMTQQQADQFDAEGTSINMQKMEQKSSTVLISTQRARQSLAA